VGCYNYWIGGIKYSEACGVNEQCIHYNFPIPQDVGEVKKICYLCKENLAACCVSGMAARYKEDCEKCGMWLSGCRCCPKGMFWSPVDLMCRERDPCYSPNWAKPTFCHFYAPNILPMSLRDDSWWSSTLRCVTPTSVCCFVDAGLFGYILPGEEFYYWHEKQNIITY